MEEGEGRGDTLVRRKKRREETLWCRREESREGSP